KSVLKNFYIRRTLRIFPIYYLVIIVLLIFQDHSGTDIGTSYPYFLTYTSNFYYFGRGSWNGIGIVSHLWSLAVEEQFYLLWPSLMLFVNKKYLIHVIYSFIAIGVISQVLLINNDMGNILTMTCFDAFGMGALLAWYLVFNPQMIPTFYKRLRIAAVIAAVLFVAGFMQKRWEVMPLLRTVISVLTLYTITYIIYKRTSGKLAFSFIWNNRILIFIGKISYGIYLYHNLIPYTTAKILERVFHTNAVDMLPHKLGYLAMLGINSIILLAVSWFSWIIIEKPVLAFKKYFEYDSKEKARSLTVV
ncbi:MAG: acyltransferase, partial [Chitinophagaceae bacterium]